MSFEEIKNQLSASRKKRNVISRQVQQTRETLRTIAARKARLKRLGLEDSQEFQEILKREKSLEKNLVVLWNSYTQAQTEAHDLLNRFSFSETPQMAVEHLDDHTPFLLFPVRLETRFKKVTSPDTGALQNELWVRIIPDDINIETHEEILTEDEVAAAQSYWTEVWRAGGDKDGELAAWRVLMRKHGSQRAAWIVRTYLPNNELDENGFSNRPTAPLPEDQELDPAPCFDPYDPKQESWSRAPQTIALPDCFVAMCFIGRQLIADPVVGKPIPEPLIAGPNPSHFSDENEGFKEDDEELKVDAEMKWMVDFEEAVRVGMGMKIPLTAHAARGFDRLIVLGLRLSSDQQEGQELLESLIEAHHYSEDGFSIVPQGTATNNTRSGGSGFKTFELGDDESFRVELGDPLFVPKFDWKRKRDGQHLADALGIDPGVLEHIQFSDGFDQRDARAMNTALWPATLGYFLEEMMDPIFTVDTIREAHWFFLNHVSGRGPIPAIRVGAQPYGILPTSSFTRWSYPVGDSAFERQLYNLLKQLDQDWDEMVKQVSYAGKEGDPQQNLLDILGLHAGSVEFYRRFAISLEQLFNMQKLNQLNQSSFDLYWWYKMTIVLKDFWDEEMPEISNKIFCITETKLDGPLIDDTPLSDTAPVRAISQWGENYLEWLANSPLDTIRRQDFGMKDGEGVEPPRALLYLMLRHAVMNAYWDSAWNYYNTAQMAYIPSRKEPTFLYIKDKDPGESKFSILYRKAGDLSKKHPEVFKNADLTVAEQISDPDTIQERPESRGLREVREALECLKDRPTSALARAFSEHIDLCSYRLDAWKLGLVNQRLSQLRRSKGNEARGIYLGAFGWLEQVKPAQPLEPFTGKAPEEFKKESDPPLQVAKGNGGYIHTPSMNHATTAAILRNAYITHANANNKSAFAVNLTSERVRTAISIIEGIQNGQQLGALLGYQFERGLHDRYNEAEVDRFIFPLRKKFPLVGDRLNKTTPDVPIEAIEARNVIDGLGILNHIRETGKSEYPFGFSTGLNKEDLPEASESQKKAINAEVNRMESSMDAVSDLLMAEGVYQVTLGNFERAGAAFDSMSGVEALPVPEILHTPRSGFAMTHRLCIQLETQIPVSLLNPYEGKIELTPRAQAEPGINKWLAGLMGEDPGQPVCKVVHIEPGAGPGGENIEHEGTVFLEDLQIQSIDLLYILDQDLQQNQSELDSRIAFAFKSKNNLAHDAKIRIDYTKPVPGQVTLFELMPLLKSLRSLILDSRALNARDMVLPSDETGDLEQNAAPDENPHGWDINDIKNRVEAAHARLDQIKVDLENDKSASPTPAQYTAMRQHLMQAASFGIQQSIPGSAVETNGEAARELIDQAETVTALIGERLKGYAEIVPVPTNISIDEQVTKWVEAGNRIFGLDFTWMPTFSFKLPGEIENAYNDSNHILRHIKDHNTAFPGYEWLHGVARVRPKAQHLETCIIMAENFETAVPELRPMQIPYKLDDFWLALDYPEDYVFDGDRLLLATVFAAPLSTNKPQAGLLVDEWSEVVPTKDETTGITFHYDAPNAEPPQTLLLAVTPELTGSWKWDDLVATLNETLDMAKKRAVEPGHIDETKYAHFLPGIMVPLTLYLNTSSTNLGVNVGEEPPLTDVKPGEEEG